MSMKDSVTPNSKVTISKFITLSGVQNHIVIDLSIE